MASGGGEKVLYERGDDVANPEAVKLLSHGSGDGETSTSPPTEKEKTGGIEEEKIGGTEEEKTGGQGTSKSSPKDRVNELGEFVRENKVFTGCVTANVILIICIFGVTLAWLSFAQNEIVGYDPNPEHLFCLKCKNLKLGDKEKLDYFPGSDDEECCAGRKGVSFVNNQLKKQVTAALNEQFKEKPLFQICMNSTTAEHPRNFVQMKNIKSIDKNSGVSNLQLIIWEANSFNSSVQYRPADTVQKNKGGFQVGRAGYYHIYSNLVFRLPGNENTTLPPADSVIRHLVLKFRKDYNVGEKLLEGYSTLCNPMSDTMFNSYISGDFFLEDTDIVKVFVNNPNLLAPFDSGTQRAETCNAGFSFYGMYLI